MRFYTLQNRSNWDMNLKIYECVIRYDTNDFTAATNAAFGTYVKALFAASDTAAVNKGPGNPAFAGAGDVLTASYQNPSFTPYMASRFCQQFRIVRTSAIRIGPNDYVKRSFSVRSKKFDAQRFDAGDYATGIGGYTKFILFSWVGGPVDTGLITDVSQSKSNPDLFVEYDMDYRFYFEPQAAPLYAIGSSNASTDMKGAATTNDYKTTTATVFVIPATETVQTVAGVPAAALHDPDDNVLEDEP